ncbi:MAG: hypothetical protein GY781_06705 [Gammaproteobacteria bacterium]|nr:hypothetical protein [Gammaproteobacteria bacterium]
MRHDFAILIELHMSLPFRDGNGRAQRLFFEELAINAGYELDWSGIEHDDWLYTNLADLNT